jgi:hypothetical protein
VSRLSEKWDRIEDNPVIMTEELSKLWAIEAEEYMADEDFGKVLDLVYRIINDGNVDIHKVPLMLVRLEAYAVKFRMRYVAYMSFKKGTDEANMKKNHYKELYTGIDRLVDALKYLAK